MPAPTSITIEGQTFTSLAKAAKYYNLPAYNVRHRIRAGWTIRQSFGIDPSPKRDSASKEICVNGHSFDSIASAAEYFNMSKSTVTQRLRSGLTPKQALGISPMPEGYRLTKAERDSLSSKELKSGKRTCKRCNKTQDFTSFWKSTASRNGREALCANCKNEKRERNLYGISRRELLELQDSCICGATTSTNGLPLHIDHDHTTGKVRGLLCSNCNHALGKVKDDINILAGLIIYLLKTESSPDKMNDIINLLSESLCDKS